MESSTRILILGMDSSGRILQFDRNAAAVLRPDPDDLLGAHLDEVIPGAREPLLEALKARRERTAMLAVENPAGGSLDAVVTVHPMNGGAPDVVALAVVRVPVPLADRFVDPAVIRRALLDDALPRIGSTLDLEMLARGLMDVLVPHFCNSGALMLLESHIDADEPPEGPDGPQLRRMAIGFDDEDPAWDATFPTGSPSSTRRVPRTCCACSRASRCCAPSAARARPGSPPRGGGLPSPSCSRAPRCCCCRSRRRRASSASSCARATPRTGRSTPTTSRSAWSSPTGRPSSSRAPGSTRGSARPR
ncbi:hypothetical protein [Actinomadura madurae]|uniref:hypothetical protein n=1 Tax=Actinomadura madurae TaxID=1993 RepID=UPI0020D26022|nr:hypothetical protein [Actinomadura madurae]MCQ0021493.1 hypothetical protein [Actinomadura madurae]